MAGLLNTAVTGLQVSQAALRTTGHNIANANTPGYSRQRVDLATNTANLSGAGYIGNGVTVTAIERIVDEFLVRQLRTDTSLNSELEAFSENIRQLDTLLSDPSTGLSQGLDKFFAVMENGADDPTSIPSRQLIISEAENLEQRFNTVYERLESINNSINRKMSTAVSRVNALAQNIAELNKKIALADVEKSPNDLLDQRDEALRELAELVKIDIVDQGDGLLNVSFGSGQALVVGGEVRNLGVIDGIEDPSQKDLAYQDRIGSQVITRFVSGGELGGLLDFRDSILSTSFNELGRVAVALSQTFNETHSKGIDLNNQFGGLFFDDVNDPRTAAARVLASGNNSPPLDRVASLEIIDHSKLSASDYRLEVSNADTSYHVTRLSDGQVVHAGTLPISFPQSIEFDGLRFNFGGGSFQSGDEFLIQPTRRAARDFASALQRPDQLAFASPVLTDADLGNTGNGTISAGSVLALKDAAGNALPLLAVEGQMSPPLLVRFNTPTSYDILDNSDPGNPVDLDPPIRNRVFVPGQNNPLFSGDPGETLVAADGAGLGIGAVGSGAAPLAAIPNGYPSEIYSFQFTNPDTGAITQRVVTPPVNSSARAIASLISDVSGVSAYARNSMVLSDFASLTGAAPLQISLNGVDLVEYSAGALHSSVPDPALDAAGFAQYLAERINADSNLSSLGIYAVAGTNSGSGQPELRVFSTQGDDFNLNLEAGIGDNLLVTDYQSASQTLTGTGAGNHEGVTVGGTLDIVLASNYRLVTNPVFSDLLGDSSAAGFASSSFPGIEASINGIPAAGDRFTVDFNTDGVSDNRNALDMVNLSSSETIDGDRKTYSDAYATLVELVGIRTNAAEINHNASEQVLTQSTDLRNSISGVNLDEEAANLIQFEQIYNANAQVIAVARDLFDRLLNSF